MTETLGTEDVSGGLLFFLQKCALTEGEMVPGFTRSVRETPEPVGRRALEDGGMFQGAADSGEAIVGHHWVWHYVARKHEDENKFIVRSSVILRTIRTPSSIRTARIPTKAADREVGLHQPGIATAAELQSVR